MQAKDLMRRDVLTVHEDDLVEELLDALVGKNLHGAPVVDAKGDLVGMISQTDIHFGAMTRSTIRAAGSDNSAAAALRVGEIMTSPPVSATEDTRIVDLCKMMRRLRLHRVPIVRGRKVTGVISSLDIVGAIARGEKLDG
jgi:CBS domain-containing protein